MRLNNLVQAVSLAGSLAVCTASCTPAVGTGAQGQAISPVFAHGADYAFERMRAVRTVRDAFDQGPITLVAYVYRPLKLDRHEVVLYSHGSTAGYAVSPMEPRAPERSVIQFFTSRGYTVVAPMRRGVSESSGTYREECPVQSGGCTLAENTALFDPGLQEAVLDSSAVIDQIIVGNLVPPEAKIVLSGVARGGFLSLVLAGERPDAVKGVVNFVGGWFSSSEQSRTELKVKRLELQQRRLAVAAAKARADTLWIYADRDPFYNETTNRELFRAFKDAGGKGEYFFVRSHFLASGHDVAGDRALWESEVDGFLKRLP